MTEIVTDDVFDRIHHSVNMLHSLQNCHDTLVMDREEVDEKLFEEMSNCEAFIKHFESVFLQIVREDLQAVSKAAVVDPDNTKKAEELIEGINRLIENFNRMESEYIAKSQSLKGAANQFRTQLTLIKKDMEAKIKLHEKSKKSLNSALTGAATSN